MNTYQTIKLNTLNLQKYNLMNKTSARKLIISPIESIFVIGYILFEELIWDVFVMPVHQYFKRLSILTPLKNYLLEIGRYPLLFLFILILAITETLGLLAGYCIINGYLYLGISIYTLKIPVATFTFWLFKLCKNKLMSFHWLKFSYDFTMDLINKIIHSPIHIFIKAQVSSLKNTVKQLNLIYFKTRYKNYKNDLINAFKWNS